MITKANGQSCREIFHSLINFFLDGDLSMHISVEGETVESEHRLMFVDITMDDVLHCDPFPAPFKIFSFDLETSVSRYYTLRRGNNRRHGNGRAHSPLLQMMRKQFWNRWLSWTGKRPDIITGYNIDNFDMGELLTWNTALIAKSNKSSERKLWVGEGWLLPNKVDEEMLWFQLGVLKARNVAGRCVMDAWWQTRQALRPQRETLKFVSGYYSPIMKMQKIDVDASKMDEEWANRPDEVLEYCLRDAELPWI